MAEAGKETVAGGVELLQHGEMDRLGITCALR